MISTYTAHPKESWAWISFLSQQTSDLPGEADGSCPLWRSTAQTQGIGEGWGDEIAAAIWAAEERPGCTPLTDVTIHSWARCKKS